MALKLAYKVRSYSTGTLGRAICNARTHHFVADDPGKDEVGAGEFFLSGIAACAVNMVERLANQDTIPLQWMDERRGLWQPGQSPWRGHGLRCHPGALRDVGRAGGTCARAGGDVEATLTPLRFGRRGDRRYIRDPGITCRGSRQIECRSLSVEPRCKPRGSPCPVREFCAGVPIATRAPGLRRAGRARARTRAWNQRLKFLSDPSST